jgi:hypothetical protein
MDGMDWKRDMMRSDAARRSPEKAKEIIRKTEESFRDVVEEITSDRDTTPRSKTGLHSRGNTFEDSVTRGRKIA